MTKTDLKAAAFRAVRTFIQAFVAVYPVAKVLDAATGSTPVDLGLTRAAAVAGIVAVVSFVWRAYVDPSGVPSLRDPDQAA